MGDLSFIIVIVAIVAIVLVIRNLRLTRSPDSFPYKKQDRLLTPAERSFFGVLEHVVGDSYRIFAKVRLGDLFRIDSRLDSKEKLRAFNKISAKHVDFVICDPESIEVLAAIELDDKSHNRTKRKTRDEFVNKVFEVAGVPLGRVPAKKGYTRTDVLGVLSQILGPPEEVVSETEADFSFGDDHQGAIADLDSRLNYVSKSKPLCSSCGNVMEEKVVEGAEGSFWVCSMAPVCEERLVVKKVG